MVTTRAPSPPARRDPPRRAVHRRRPASRRTYLRRRVLAGVAATVLVVFVWASVSFVGAVTNPANGTSFSARAAEWARGHGAGFIVNWAETEWYRLHPPKKGGAPGAGSFSGGTTPTTTPAVAAVALPVPARLRSPAGAWLPGEGVWHPVGRTVKGAPAVYVTTVRPDPVYTSYVVGVAWMDPRLLSTTLYSGSQIPGGGPYAHTAPITPLASRTLDAAFNAGFRIQDAQGGYYTEGKTVAALRTGAASLVTYADGSATVGAWNQQVKMSPQVTSVRQNLDPIVNAGVPVAGLSRSDNHRWGATLGGSFAVWRSGLGVTRQGALVYVGGPSLTITSLANLLVAAGAVRAMELDINTDWVQYSYFTAPHNVIVTGAQGVSMLSNMAGSPSRYFASWWTRDFFTASVREAPLMHQMAPIPR